MKRAFAVLVSLWALGFGAQFPARGADAAEEARLIETVHSEHSLQEKDAACARLKNIGTAACVPALAALLTDDQLSHSARYALESMPIPEAGQALLNALGKTSGSNQVGIIHSLAMRHDSAAAPQLGALMASDDSEVAVAAAQALGRIGGPQAIPSLEAAASGSTGAVHRAQIDALLACAYRFLKDGMSPVMNRYEHQMASTIFQRIYDGEKGEDARLAAFRGLILASGERGVALMTDAIAGADAPSQGAALQLAVNIKGAAATQALSDLLPKVQPPVQIALLQCLTQRGDPSAMEPVARLADSQDADVRVAAITALGDLGDNSVALLLARKAASAPGAERDAARQALRDLRRGPVTVALLDSLAGAAPDVQLELFGALDSRGDRSAAPKILELAPKETGAVRSAAFQALASLAGAAQIPKLVQLVINDRTGDVRSQAAETLGAICQRNQSKLSPLDVQPVVSAVQTAPLEARLALMPVCGALTGAPAREALRAAMRDPEPQVREAALRALCDTRDGELLPELVKIASASAEQKARVLAIRGCVRLATQEEGVKLSNAQKLDAFKTIIDARLDDPEKRLILSALSTVADDQALALATPMLQDPAVASDAAQAVIHIADAISARHPAEAGAALKKVLAMTINPATRQSAEAAVKKIQ
jgi:HEAT repeat protein